jgi:hypothetical protein
MCSGLAGRFSKCRRQHQNSSRLLPERAQGNDEQHRLTPGRRLVERVRPALAGGDAALGVEVEENVVRPAPALADEPILQRDRPVVIFAGMTDEKA